MMGEVVHDIQAPLGLSTGNLDMVVEMLDDYRQLVQQYDAAVQYCLQPVDLIFSADKSSLDKLLKFVEDARRKLFDARTILEKTTLIKDAKALLADSRGSLGELVGVAANVKEFVRAGDDTPALVDVNASLDHALALAQHRLRNRVQVVKRASNLPKLRCVASQLDQVFLSLIANAALAIEGQGTLTIDAESLGDSIEISFADSGSGIAADNLPKVFDLFFTTRPMQSGGLGLAIAHNFVTELGGTIEVRTTPHKGSIFTMSLPLTAAAASVNG
jgi:signal transduction histidine kinase